MVLWILFNLMFSFGQDDVLAKANLKAFLAEAFEGNPPISDILILDPEMKTIMGRFLTDSRIDDIYTYWTQDKRTVWFINRMGKEKPISIGILIDNETISRIQILRYREERGWEIKLPHFLDQFNGFQFHPSLGASRTIDSISGATISVDAVTDSAKLALQLESQLRAQ